jgi:hypothetical protein
MAAQPKVSAQIPFVVIDEVLDGYVMMLTRILRQFGTRPPNDFLRMK